MDYSKLTREQLICLLNDQPFQSNTKELIIILINYMKDPKPNQEIYNKISENLSKLTYPLYLIINWNRYLYKSSFEFNILDYQCNKIYQIKNDRIDIINNIPIEEDIIKKFDFRIFRDTYYKLTTEILFDKDSHRGLFKDDYDRVRPFVIYKKFIVIDTDLLGHYLKNKACDLA